MSLLAGTEISHPRAFVPRRTVTASELIRTLATTATIRRDLEALKKEGVLVRSHGGAVSRTSATNIQPSYEALGGAIARKNRRSPVKQNG